MLVCFCGHIVLILLNIYLGVELLNHMVTSCLPFLENAKAELFSKLAAPFYVRTSKDEVPVSLHLCQCVLLSFCFSLLVF